MNIKIDYFDNIINLNEDKVNAIEIENMGCFFRTVSNLIQISNGFLIEDIYCYDNENNEINLSNKLLIVNDYFDLTNVLKKYNTNLQKSIINEIKEDKLNELTLKYKQLIDKLKSSISEIDLPIKLNDEFSLEQLIKLTKPTIETKENLINNLYLLIDLEKIFKINKLLIFVNLKQYLTKQEILEFYKYTIYNKVPILLFDNKSYSISLENEVKLLVDDNLDEFML